jgi:hypothetical protein
MGGVYKKERRIIHHMPAPPLAALARRLAHYDVVGSPLIDCCVSGRATRVSRVSNDEAMDTPIIHVHDS